MILDASTRRNLELTETMREKQKRGSLLWVIDKTKTAMGSRLLRSYTEQPLIDVDKINNRLDAVEELLKKVIDREEIIEYLNPVYDLERLLSKISYHTANPRDLISFKMSLSYLPSIKNIIDQELSSEECRDISDNLDPLSDIYTLIDSAIEDEPPIAIKEGNIIKSGYNEEVDRLKNAKTEGKKWLSELEERDRERTGIKNLKIKYNKVFGYYFEVTNSFKDLVPDDYIRKQTEVALSDGERVGIIATEETYLNYSATVVQNIGSRDDEATIARRLYAVLREFDEDGITRIYSEEFDTPNMGQAIMNRLIKAAGHHIINLA